MSVSLEDCKKLLETAYNEQEGFKAYDGYKEVIRLGQQLDHSNNEVHLLLGVAYLCKANCDFFLFSHDVTREGNLSQYREPWKKSIEEAYGHLFSGRNWRENCSLSLTEQQRALLATAYRSIGTTFFIPTSVDKPSLGILAVDSERVEREAKARQEGEAARGKPVTPAVTSANVDKQNRPGEISLDSLDSGDKNQEQVAKDKKSVMVKGAKQKKANRKR